MAWELTIAITVGTVLGFLAGLGVGGGSLLMLWLTLCLGIDSSTARGINLLFFLPCACISCFFRKKQGLLPWKKLIPAIIAGCICAGVCSWISTELDTSLLRKLFGVLLLFTGLREIFYKTKSRS